MKKSSRLAVRLALAFAVAASPLGFVAPPAAHAQDHHEQAPTTIPDTVPALWAEIGKHRDELAATIQAKKLADVHHYAYAIRDLVAVLPAKAVADKKARVEGASKNMAALAEKLDAAGDNNQQADVEAGLKQLDALLKQLRAQFPDAA